MASWVFIPHLPCPVRPDMASWVFIPIFLATSGLAATAAGIPAPPPPSNNNSSTSVQCYAPDRAALRSLAAAASLGGFFAQSWISEDCCAWQGVFCSGIGRVSTLDLSNAFGAVIYGPIPASVCNLSALTSLTLYQVELTGPIPDCLGTHLTQLQDLDLTLNQLTGAIPATFSNLNKSLQYLSLGNNILSGTLPSSAFAQFSQLEYLVLQSNSLSGSIPTSLYSPSLWYIDLSNNNLTGSIPTSLSALNQSLKILLLNNNQLSGPLPSQVVNHLNLSQQLDLSSNSFSGPLLPLSSPYLQSLDLHQNLLSGNLTLFSSLSKLSSLTSLNLGSNLFHGAFPNSLQSSRFPSLTDLTLSHNSLTSRFPASLCNFTSLVTLDLSNNGLSEGIDQSDLQNCQQTLVKLQIVRLSHNQLSGAVPEWILSLPATGFVQGSGGGTIVDLSNNLIHSLPNHVPNASKNLESLFLANNDISGPFPVWIGSFALLQILDLSYNHFNGSLPQNWANLSSLYYFDMSNDNLLNLDPSHPRGTILPRWLFQLPSMLFLYLGSIQLSSAGMGDCNSKELYPVKLMVNTSISELDLSHNDLNATSLSCFFDSTRVGNHSPNAALVLHTLNLSGNPLAVTLGDPLILNMFTGASIVSIQSLDLSYCKLRGHLHESFLDYASLSGMGALFAAHNALTGEIPQQLANITTLSYLDLSDNSITSIGTFDGNRTLFSIADLNLSNNSLSGSLESVLSKLSNGSNNVPTSSLFNIDLSYNHLNGAIPGNLLARFPGLDRLKLDGNLFEGTIPQELLQPHTFPSLHTLSLSENMLKGVIPAPFTNHKGLVFLDLHDNRLEGDMQASIFGTNASNVAMPSLRVLLLSYNNFTGFVPAWLGKLTPSLQVIDLSNNHLTGAIPLSFEELKAFQTTAAGTSKGQGASNILYEDITIQVKGAELTYAYVLEVLVSLDLSGNDLTGSIPTGLGVLSGLVFLNLSRNNLSGQIPPDLGELTMLETLDLSFNNLEGSIPTSFSNLTQLGVFNLSYNKALGGSIPPNNPQIQNQESYLGDPDVSLCGILSACSPLDESPSVQPVASEEVTPSFFTSFIDAWVSIPGFFLGLFVGVAGGFILVMKLTMACNS